MADMVPVRVPGMDEPVLFPRDMSAADIQTAIERDVLPTLKAPEPQPTAGLGAYGPPSHPWVQANAMAAQGKTPTGEPVGSPLVDLAAGAMRYGPPALTSFTPGMNSAVAAGSEAAAQGIERVGGTREEFDPTAVGVAAASPPAMAGGAKLLQRGAKMLPGAAATLHDMAKSALERLSTIFGPSQSADELYALVRQQNPSVAMPKLKEVAGNLLSEEQLAEAGLKLSKVAKTASAVEKRLSEFGPAVPPGEMPFDAAFLNLKRIGGKIRETRIEGGEEHGAWKQLWKAGMEDLEAAANSGSPAAPAVQALKQANAAARREYVSEEIASIFTKGGLTARPDIGPDAFAVNFSKIANDLRKGRYADDIKGVLKPEEYTGLLERVSELAQQTPNLPPPRGQFAGSAVRIGQIAAGGAAGYLAGPSLGVNPETASAAGVIVGTKGVEIMTRLMMSDSGRQLLTHFLSQTGGIVTGKVLSVLGLAAAQLPEVKGVTQQLGLLGRDYMQETK